MNAGRYSPRRPAHPLRIRSSAESAFDEVDGQRQRHNSSQTAIAANVTPNPDTRRRTGEQHDPSLFNSMIAYIFRRPAPAPRAFFALLILRSVIARLCVMRRPRATKGRRRRDGRRLEGRREFKPRARRHHRSKARILRTWRRTRSPLSNLVGGGGQDDILRTAAASRSSILT